VIIIIIIKRLVIISVIDPIMIPVIVMTPNIPVVTVMSYALL